MAENVELNVNEKEVLSLGPKFCILNNLSEDTLQRELEECIVKNRWEMMSQEYKDEERKKFGKDAFSLLESLFSEDELRQHDEEKRLYEAKMRMHYDLVRFPYPWNSNIY